MVRRGLLFLVGFAMVVSGCVGPETGSATKAGTTSKKVPGLGGIDAGELPGYWVLDSVGAPITPPEELAKPIHIGEFLTGKAGGEPSGGVTKNGDVFLVAGLSTMKSTDHGQTWKEVYNHRREGVPGLNGSSDPLLWVDPVTDRIFTDHMFGLHCSNMAFSDNGGATWTQRPLVCGVPGNDHQKWASGPWSKKGPQPPSPAPQSVVYYCYNKAAATTAIGQTWCAVSYNGGLAFQHDQPVVGRQFGHPCGGINGHPAPAPDGTMYVPLNRGCGRPVVAVTEDNGVTWTVRSGPTTFGGAEIDPDVTVTPDGTAYMQYRGSDHQQYLVRSKDKFVTWEGPWRVTPPHIYSSVFAGITSGDNGRIAMAYLATDDFFEAASGTSKNNPALANETVRWHLMITYSLNAADKEPVFATTQATPEEDPVQIGCIWLSGGGNPCRNLLDFIDMATDKEGRIFAIIADGCGKGHRNGDCAYNVTAKADQSRSRDVAVGVTLDGPSLIAAKGRIAAAVAAAKS
ncbi:MAG: exo-alpha-sialidase [Euryarchaeota archaeon]|nr:exo-alpha-sialidase [Euryarchaeota archaeon]